MTKPLIRIHDLSTNDIVDREMTDSEFESYQAKQAAEAEAVAIALAAKESAEAKLAALGLTSEDLKALGL